jgi:hypothetical protein
MNGKILIGAGAAMLLALGGAVAEARSMHGIGGGNSGGMHAGNMGGGRASFGRSFGGMHQSFGGGRIAGGNRGFSHRGPVVGFNSNRHFGRHGRFGRGVIVGAPYYYGDDYGYDYSSGCGWLYSRAVQTGSSYWWRRYEICEGEG